MPQRKRSPKAIKAFFNLDDLKKVIFTKDDAGELRQEMRERFAAVDRELVNKANKSDLEHLATKQDLSRLETRLEEKIDRLEKQVSHVVFKEHASALEDHEKRLDKVEKIVFSSN
ncbi:MAG: hypothetical protein HY401_03580 [Elusimicrobia bacterium]|nr:hypothetical protein [Elusimicrobiota bacterium]